MKDLIDGGLSYGDLLAMLRKDLQLDAGTDLLNKSVGPDSMAPQVAGSVSIATFNAANGARTALTGWTTLASGTYLKASTAGLTAVRAGVYLMRAHLRWDGGVTGLRALSTVVNATVDLESEVVQPASAQGPGEVTLAFPVCAPGDVLSLAYLQNQGGVVATGSASVTAYWIGNNS